MAERAVELKRSGNRAMASRDYATARDAFESLIRDFPEVADGYVGLSKVLARLNDHERTVEVLEPALERVSSSAMLRALGDAYRVLAYRGDETAVEPAIQYYLRYREVRREPQSLYYLGELHRELKKDYEQALRFLRESWELEPGSPSIRAAAEACAKKLGFESPGLPG